MEAASDDPTGRRRIVVLVSGAGSNLHALLEATAQRRIHAEIVGVVSNRAAAGGLERARAAGVGAHVLEPESDESRADYDTRLGELVAGLEPDLVVLAGWMRMLTMNFLRRFDRVVNLHPALPGELPGTRAIERAYEQARAGERDRTGVMVHLVPDEGVDDGPVLATTTVAIQPTDTIEELTERVHRAEHELLVHAVGSLCAPTDKETIHVH